MGSDPWAQYAALSRRPEIEKCLADRNGAASKYGNKVERYASVACQDVQGPRAHFLVAILIGNALVIEVSFPGTMQEFTWSPTQKKAARAAFDLALAREFRAIREEAEGMLRNSSSDRVIWRLHDYLDEKRREIDQKYDYRYSVLMQVFPLLVSEGWLKVEELIGIGAEKVDVIKKLRSLREL
jgi:hypothetical protein